MKTNETKAFIILFFVKCLIFFGFLAPPQKKTGVKSDINVFTYQNENYKTFDEFLENFHSEISGMNLSQKNTDQVYSITERMVNNMGILCRGLLKKTDDAESAISTATHYITNKLTAHKTSYRREKIVRQQSTHVQPVEMPIATKWKNPKPNAIDIIPDHNMEQTKYQLVRIREQFTKALMDTGYKNMYLDYNLNEKHVYMSGRSL